MDRKPGKTLVVGCQSFIGKQFYEVYCSLYPDTLGTHYKSADRKKRVDLLNPSLDLLELVYGEYKWALIAAANTNLRRCESEKGAAFRCNVEGTIHLVRGLLDKGITPIIFSSDYVFDGIQGGYTEDFPKNPLNEYGRQKDLLEEQILEISKGDCLVVRCSKIFGLNPGDNTLIDQIAGPLLQQLPIKAAYDQFFAPIHEADVLRAVLKLQSLDCRGIFNLCGPEIWNRLDLAKAIGNLLMVNQDLILPISLDDLEIPYGLPKHTYMNCDKFYKATNETIVPLSQCLKALPYKSLVGAKWE